MHELIQTSLNITRGGRTELTQQQWARVMGMNPSQFSGADRPVESVTFRQMEDFRGRRKRMKLRFFDRFGLDVMSGHV